MRQVRNKGRRKEGKKEEIQKEGMHTTLTNDGIPEFCTFCSTGLNFPMSLPYDKIQPSLKVTSCFEPILFQMRSSVVVGSH